jgi:hypothetical protein
MSMTSFLSLLVVSFLFVFSSCQDSAEPVQQVNQNDSAEFLLIASEDPLNIETESAFMIDGAGPMYFAVLELTEEQKQQIEEIVSKYQEEFQGLCGSWREGISWENIREERQALREEINTAIYEILTDEQKAILDEIQEQLENGQYPDILVEKKVAHLTENLSLSSDQQAEITDLFKEYGNLLVASRDESQNRFDFLMAKRELFMELDSKIRALLTDDQLILYNEMKSEHIRNRFRHHRKP